MIHPLSCGARLATTLVAVLAILCGASDPCWSQSRLKVVATFSVLGDLVAAVGGGRIEVINLVGPDSDAHVYSPAPADVRKITDAHVIVTNGLGFDGWSTRLVRASGSRAPVIEATIGIAPRRLPDGHPDPHAWQSAILAKDYVGNIRDALVRADPAGQAVYAVNATAYLASLDALDRELRAAVEAVSAERRRVISTHDAFGYFQDAYGIAFIAPQGMSTDTEASARDVARVITQIRREKIPAVFLENVSDPRLMERIAKEAGARVGGRLYSDALTGPAGEAPTYVDMMRHNMRTIIAALNG
jgi:zinc/manganese transport system substrate-binding protein